MTSKLHAFKLYLLLGNVGKSMQFDGAELAKATRNYNRRTLLGKGGFGSVYRGTLRGG